MANVLNRVRWAGSRTGAPVDRFLRGRGLTHVFQPVFDITNGECFVVEALARFSGRPKRTPDVWFAEAHELGVGVELQITSVKRALGNLPHLPGDIALCVNAGPEAMVSEVFAPAPRQLQTEPLVVELTEEARVDDYERLSGALGRAESMEVHVSPSTTPVPASPALLTS